MTIVLVAVCALGLIGCNRSQVAVSAQGVTGVMAQPATTKPATVQGTAASASSSTPAVVPSTAPAAAVSGALVKLVPSDNTQSFTIADHTFRMLIHSQRIEREPGKTAEEAVEWWELRNSKDQVVHREQYPVNVVNGMFDFSVAVSASAFKTAEGAGILVERSEEPSDPLSGGSVQVFGYKYGRDKYGVDESLFQSFGPPIWVEGDYLGIGQDEIHPTPTLPRGVTMMTINDVLRFKVWTGNFFVMYPVRINWITGQLEPAHRCIETTSKGRVERCRYPVEVDAHREGETTFVRLFPEADEAFTPKHVVLQPDTKIEFLEASVQIAWAGDAKAVNFSVNGDIWLKVRIAGQEGWIHSEEDFQAVGLPQSG